MQLPALLHFQACFQPVLSNNNQSIIKLWAENLLKASCLFEYSAAALTCLQRCSLFPLSCPPDFLTLIKKNAVGAAEPSVSAGGLQPRLLLFPDEQRSSVNESSSLLGGSPQRHCRRKSSPYHTGQLHPAVRVADLLQHINQMKTAEGYGFKQEYEVNI